MSTLTSRPVRLNRNFLLPHEKATVERYKATIAKELEQWISGSDLLSIKLTPKDELIRLHHSLGTAVRNEYELWMPEHDVTSIWKTAEKEFPLGNGVHDHDIHIGARMVSVMTSCPIDDHPCHPDNFSFSCIERLWENLQ